MKKLSLLLLILLSKYSISDTMVGAYLPYDGWSVTQMATFNQNSNKQAAFINLFSTFSHKWHTHLKYQSNNIASVGATPMISWMPIDNSRSSTNILPEIVNGDWDSYLTQWAAGLQSWINTQPTGASIMIRFGHEFNGNWYSYGDDPSNFVAAWQYIHDFLELEGVNDYIQWVWCANYVSVDSHNDITLYYPGNTYVDWTGLDGYNWGSNYSFTQWKSFENVFANSYLTLVNNYPSKPIMIAEVGSTEEADTPRTSWGQDGDNSDVNESKALWVQNMLLTIPSTFPAIRALCLFNYNKELGWSLYETTSQGVVNTGLTEWNNEIIDSHYTSTLINVNP